MLEFIGGVLEVLAGGLAHSTERFTMKELSKNSIGRMSDQIPLHLSHLVRPITPSVLSVVIGVFTGLYAVGAVSGVGR